MAKPVRIQLRRAKGWRMPENTVKVDRTTKWGNPFVVGRDGTRAECVRWHALLLAGFYCFGGPEIDAQRAYRKFVGENLEALKGKNLACWCAPGARCHADLLLDLARQKPGKRRSKIVDEALAELRDPLAGAFAREKRREPGEVPFG